MDNTGQTTIYLERRIRSHDAWRQLVAQSLADPVPQQDNAGLVVVAQIFERSRQVALRRQEHRIALENVGRLAPDRREVIVAHGLAQQHDNLHQSLNRRARHRSLHPVLVSHSYLEVPRRLERVVSEPAAHEIVNRARADVANAGRAYVLVAAIVRILILQPPSERLTELQQLLRAGIGEQPGQSFLPMLQIAFRHQFVPVALDNHVDQLRRCRLARLLEDSPLNLFEQVLSPRRHGQYRSLT